MPPAVTAKNRPMVRIFIGGGDGGMELEAERHRGRNRALSENPTEKEGYGGRQTTGTHLEEQAGRLMKIYKYTPRTQTMES